MKRLFYMMLICISVIVLWGCTENGTEDEPTPPISYLEFSEETDISPEFEADGGTSLVEFTSSHDWTASANQSWITLSRKSGTPQKTYFNITVSKNSSTSKRTGTVTITADNKSYKINVSQQGAEKAVFEFSSDTDTTPEFEAKGGTSKVSFTTSHDWTANANQSWISLSRKSGTTSNSNFTITVSENTSTSQRSGTVTITSNSKSYKVSISQKGKEETVFEFSSDTNISPEFESEGGTSKVSFTTSHDWTANANQSWISLSRKSGSTSNSNFTITVSENTSTSQRTGTVTITSNSKSYKINVSQKAYEENEKMPVNQIYYKSIDGNIVIPNKIDAFGGTTAIVSNTYENGQGIITFDWIVTSIGDEAFRGCNTLTEITLPNSITDVGNRVFFNCPNLKFFYGKFASEDNRCLVVNGELKCLSPQVEGDYTLPSSITSLGRTSLFGFRKRVSITIPNSVTSLSDVCCTSTYNVEKFYGKFASADNLALIKDNTLYGVAVYGQTAYSIPEGVTNIMENVFQNCTKLETITLPSSVSLIGQMAFNSCKSLTILYCKAITPPQIESNSNIFRNIETVPTIYVPFYVVETYKTTQWWKEYASYIKGYDFPDAPIESTFEFSSDTDTSPEFEAKGGTSKVSFTTSHDWTVSASRSWISLSLKSGTTSNSNFTITVSENTSTSQRTGIVTITSNGKSYEISISQKGKIEGSLDNMECKSNEILYKTSDGYVITLNKESGFGGKLVSNTYENGVGRLTFDADVTDIGADAFRECTTIEEIKFPNSVTSIGKNAFYECTSLTSVSIPNSITWIGKYAFSGCYSLPVVNGIRYADTYLVGAIDKTQSSYDIKKSTVFIGEEAFGGCYNLRSITIPNSVTSIGDYAFMGSDRLVNAIIGSSVTSIGTAAFSECTSLTSIVIPDSVIYINNLAFADCTSLTSVVIGNSVVRINYAAFLRCTSLLEVYCRPITPPTPPNDTILEIQGWHAFDSNASGRKIYVPRSSVSTYKWDSNWKAYADSIVGYDF